MPQQRVPPNTVTVTPIADGLAYVYGRVVGGRATGAPSWEYLGSSTSRDDVLEQARRAAHGGQVRVDELPSSMADVQAGIAPTRPPADS